MKEVELLEKYGLIYKIINLINGKIYIGQTVKTLKKRWNEHKHDAHNKKRKLYNSHLYESIRKYDIENFSTEEIEVCNSQNELDKREDYWISFYDSMNRNKGYNLKRGGSRGKLSEESIRKLRKSLKKYYQEHPEMCKEISERMKDDKNPMKRLEVRKKLSESTKGEKHWNYGKHHSEKTKKKMSESTNTPEKRSNTIKNLWKTIEYRENHSIKLYGKLIRLYGKPKKTFKNQNIIKFTSRTVDIS